MGASSPLHGQSVCGPESGCGSGTERMHRRPLDHEITQPRTLMIKERRVCMFSNLEKPSMGGYIVVSRAFSSVLGRLEFTRLAKKFAKLYYHYLGKLSVIQAKSNFSWLESLHRSHAAWLARSSVTLKPIAPNAGFETLWKVKFRSRQVYWACPHPNATQAGIRAMRCLQKVRQIPCFRQ